MLWGSGCFGVHGCLGSSEGLRVPSVGAAFGDPASLTCGTHRTLPLLENMPPGLPGSSELDRLTTTGAKEDKFAGQGTDIMGAGGTTKVESLSSQDALGLGTMGTNTMALN